MGEGFSVLRYIKDPEQCRGPSAKTSGCVGMLFLGGSAFVLLRKKRMNEGKPRREARQRGVLIAFFFQVPDCGASLFHLLYRLMSLPSTWTW